MQFRESMRNERLTLLKQRYSNAEQALKEIGSILYGVLGSDHFEFRNKQVAESITDQARHLVHYTNQKLNDYFSNEFVDDIDLHQSMGISIVSKVKNDNFIIYNDTDSIFLELGTVISSTNWRGTNPDFVKGLFKHRLSAYIQLILDDYSRQFDTPPILRLKFTKIFDKLLFLSKRNYVYRSNGNIDFTGFTAIKSDTPKFCRDMFDEIVNYLLGESKFKMVEFVDRIKKIKALFKMQPLENICSSVKITTYRKWVVDDTNDILLRKGANVHIQAAASHNFLLNSSKIQKYRKIRDKDKPKFYRTVDGELFAFISNSFPYEFAPDIDYEYQFNTYFLKPVNTLLVAIGQPTLETHLLIKHKI